MPEVTQINPTLMTRIIERLQQSTSGSGSSLRPEQQDLGEWNRGREHQPFVLTTDESARLGNYLVFWANPSQWGWTMNQRGMLQKTRGGTVAHMWRSRLRPTYYDEIALTISFQSGNVMPIRLIQPGLGSQALSSADRALGVTAGGAADTVQIVTPPGLLNFYEYLEIKDERKILDTGQPNFVSIIACSPVFPQIVLKGYFNPEGFSFSESADDIGSVQWEDSFTILHTYPELRASQLRSVFEAFSGQDAITQVLRDQFAAAQSTLNGLNPFLGFGPAAGLLGNGAFPNTSSSGTSTSGATSRVASNFNGIPPAAGGAAPDLREQTRTGAGTNPNVTGTAQPMPPSAAATGGAALSVLDGRIANLEASYISVGLMPDAQRAEYNQLLAQRQSAQNQLAANGGNAAENWVTQLRGSSGTSNASNVASRQQRLRGR